MVRLLRVEGKIAYRSHISLIFIFGFLTLIIFTPSLPAFALDCSGTAVPFKAPLSGLVSMGNIDFNRRGGAPDNSLADLYARPRIFAGVALNITWAQVEPGDGVLDMSPIDGALAAVCKYNQQFEINPLRVSLRLWAGRNAPAWIERLGGAAVTVVRRSTEISIGRFWSNSYREAWRKLQTRLAEIYDANPLIAGIENSSCSANSDEPFILSLDKFSLANLHEAGFTDAAYQACLEDSYLDYSGWHVTPIEYPFNAFHHTDKGPQLDWDFTRRLMEEWRRRLGRRGILANHGLGNSAAYGLGDFAAPERGVLAEETVLAALTQIGPPIELQLYSPKTDPAAAISSGLSYGASEIELWDGPCRGCSFAKFSNEELAQWAAQIAHGNPVRR